MGFSSFLCCKSKQSIPAYPYAGLPAVLSHVRIIFPDQSFIEGTYDGYGRIHAREDFQAYCNKETSEKYHEDQETAYFYWDELEKRGFLTSDSSWDDLYTKMKIVRMIDYNGEKFEDLAKLESCEEQGYFYSRATREKLLDSIKKASKPIKKKTYYFYSDPGHGWLKVSRKDLFKLGLLDIISSYSYARGNFVYLEEDGDLSSFLTALGKDWKDKIIIKQSHTNKRSRIRNYASYSKGNN